MKWRNISEDEVLQTILYPDDVVDSIHQRQNAFKHLNQKWLKVTFKEELDKIIIITAIDKNN